MRNIVLLCIAVLLISDCRSNQNSETYSNSDKILFLENFYKSPVCVEDTMSVNNQQIEQFRHYLDFHSNAKYLIYVSSDDCSVCLAALLDFLKIYSFIEDVPSFYLLVKSDSRDIVDFYIQQDLCNFNKDNIDRIQNLKIVLIPFDSEFEDGMYLLYGDKVVRYSPWRIY